MLRAGDRVVVRTPDRRAFRGVLVELRRAAEVSGPEQAVVRLDTGWLTTYPASMVHREELPPTR